MKEHVRGYKALSQLAETLYMWHIGPLTASRKKTQWWQMWRVTLSEACTAQVGQMWSLAAIARRKAATSDLRLFILTLLFNEKNSCYVSKQLPVQDFEFNPKVINLVIEINLAKLRVGWYGFLAD